MQTVRQIAEEIVAREGGFGTTRTIRAGRLSMGSPCTPCGGWDWT